MDSFGLDPNSNVEEERSSAPPEEGNELPFRDEGVNAGDQPQVKRHTSECSVESESSAESPSHTTGDKVQAPS